MKGLYIEEEEEKEEEENAVWGPGSVARGAMIKKICITVAVP